jgi:hypothetical protein
MSNYTKYKFCTKEGMEKGLKGGLVRSARHFTDDRTLAFAYMGSDASSGANGDLACKIKGVLHLSEFSCAHEASSAVRRLIEPFLNVP